MNMFIVSASGGQNHKLGQILTFGGAPVPTPFYPNEGQIWCARADPRSTLTGQISSECVHCVGFRWPKPQFWTNFDIFGGSCINALLPMRAKFGGLEQTQGLHLPAKFHLNVFIVSAYGGQKLQFWANFDIFGGSCIDALLPDQIWCAIADPRSTLTCQISSRSVYSVALWRRKTPNFCDFLDFGI